MALNQNNIVNHGLDIDIATHAVYSSWYNYRVYCKTQKDKGDFFQERHDFKFPAKIVFQIFQKLCTNQALVIITKGI